jgi:hypothetical protein
MEGIIAQLKIEVVPKYVGVRRIWKSFKIKARIIRQPIGQYTNRTIIDFGLLRIRC